MEKQAARYASQPTINIQPSVPFQGMARSSALFPFTQGTDLFKAQQQGRNNPNPVASPKTPLPVLANTEGIQQAFQKQGEEFTWLLNAIRDAFIFSKRADVLASSTGSSNKPQSNKTISPSFSNNFTNTNKNQSNFSILSNNTQPGMPGSNTNNPLGGFGMVGSMMGGMNRNNQIKPSINLGIHTSSPTPMKMASLEEDTIAHHRTGGEAAGKWLGSLSGLGSGAATGSIVGYPVGKSMWKQPGSLRQRLLGTLGMGGFPILLGGLLGMHGGAATGKYLGGRIGENEGRDKLKEQIAIALSKDHTSTPMKTAAMGMGMGNAPIPGPASMPPAMGGGTMPPGGAPPMPPPGMPPQGAGGAMPPPMPPGGAPPPGAQGQPPMPGQPPGMQPPMAPMTQPPPMPLPSNPVPPQSKPKTSQQAQEEANMLGLLESKQAPDTVNQDMKSNLMASDVKMGVWKYATTLAKQGSHDPRMQGWHWKALQKEENSNKDNWLPRLVTSDKTPLSEMLASPGKSGILGGILGGGAGALGGHNINSLINTGNEDWKNSLIGGGVGALLGGFGGFSHRVKQNDKVSDALRRLPAGATLDDMKGLDKTKSGFDKLSFTLPEALIAGTAATTSGAWLGKHDSADRPRPTGAMSGGAIGLPVGTVTGGIFGSHYGDMLERKFPRHGGRFALPITIAGLIAGGYLGSKAGIRLGGGAKQPVTDQQVNINKTSFDKYADPMTPLQRYQASQAQRYARTLAAQQALQQQEVHNADVRGPQVPGQQQGWGSSGSGGVRAIPGGRATVTSQGGGYTPQRPNPRVQVSSWSGQDIPEEPAPMKVQPPRGPLVMPGQRPEPQPVSPNPRGVQDRLQDPPRAPVQAPPVTSHGTNKPGVQSPTDTNELMHQYPVHGINTAGEAKPGVYGTSTADTMHRYRRLGSHLAGEAKSGFDKYGAQAKDKYHSPQRSATGESKGLSFNHKSDDYAQGQEAWAATSKYFKGGSKKTKEPNPFIGDHIGKEASLLELTDTPFVRGFLSHCKLLGLSNNFIKQAMTKLEKDYPEGAVELKAALEKRAFSKAYTFQFEKQAGLPELASGFWKGIATHAWPAVKPVLKPALKTLGGGVAGSFAGEAMGVPGTMHPFGGDENPESGTFNNIRHGLGFNPIGFAMGAGSANPYLRKALMKTDPGRVALRGVQHAIIGADTGMVGDIGLHQMGLDTEKYVPGGFGAYGGYGGLGLGIARGLGAPRPNFGTQAFRTFKGRNPLDPQRYSVGLFNQAPLVPWLKPVDDFGRQALNKARNFGQGFMEPGWNAMTYPARKLMSTMPGAKPTSFFGNAGNWMGGPTRNMSQWAGRAFGGLGLGVGAAVGANDLIKGYGKNLAQESAHEMYPEFAQRTMNDTAGFLDQYMQSRGMLNQQGQFSPLGNIGQHIGNFSDNILQSMNMNPHTMSPMQKMMVLGGGAAGLGGAMTGHPMLAGGGGLTALMGALPQFMNKGYNQGGHQDRNEWEYQQRLAQQRGQNGREF